MSVETREPHPGRIQAHEIDFSGGEFPLPQATNEGHDLLRQVLMVNGSTPAVEVRKFTWQDWYLTAIKGNNPISHLQRLITWALTGPVPDRNRWEQISAGSYQAYLSLRRQESAILPAGDDLSLSFWRQLVGFVDHRRRVVYMRSYPYQQENELYGLTEEKRLQAWQRLNILKALTQVYLFSAIIPRESQEEYISLYPPLIQGNLQFLFGDILRMGTENYLAILTEKRLIEGGFLQPDESICFEEEQRLCFGSIIEKSGSFSPLFVDPSRPQESRENIEALIKTTQTTVWPQSSRNETTRKREWLELSVNHRYPESAKTLGYFFISESLRGTPPEQLGEHLRTIFAHLPEDFKDLMTPSRWRS